MLKGWVFSKDVQQKCGYHHCTFAVCAGLERLQQCLALRRSGSCVQSSGLHQISVLLWQLPPQTAFIMDYLGMQPPSMPSWIGCTYSKQGAFHLCIFFALEHKPYLGLLLVS